MLKKAVDKKVGKIEKIAKANGVNYIEAFMTWEATAMARRVDGFLDAVVELARAHVPKQPVSMGPTRLILSDNQENVFSAHQINNGDYVKVMDIMQEYWVVIHGIGDNEICGFLMNDISLMDGEDLTIGQHVIFSISKVFEVREGFPKKELFGGKEIKMSDFKMKEELVLPLFYKNLDVVRLSTLDDKIVWVQVLAMKEHLSYGVIVNEVEKNEPYDIRLGDIITFFETNVLEVKNMEDYENLYEVDKQPTEESTTK